MNLQGDELSQYLHHHARNKKAKNIFHLKKETMRGQTYHISKQVEDDTLVLHAREAVFHFGERLLNQAQTQTPTSCNNGWYPHKYGRRVTQ